MKYKLGHRERPPGARSLEGEGQVKIALGVGSSRKPLDISNNDSPLGWDSERAPTFFCSPQVAARLLVFIGLVECWLSKPWIWDGSMRIWQNKIPQSFLVLSRFSHLFRINSPQIAANLWLISRGWKMFTLTIFVGDFFTTKKLIVLHFTFKPIICCELILV